MKVIIFPKEGRSIGSKPEKAKEWLAKLL